MTKSRFVCGSIVAAVIFAGGMLVGQTMVTPSAPPKVTAGAAYPNVQAAQRAIIQAWNAATAAQKQHANSAQFTSDINTAGRYLNQANDELLLATEGR